MLRRSALFQNFRTIICKVAARFFANSPACWCWISWSWSLLAHGLRARGSSPAPLNSAADLSCCPPLFWRWFGWALQINLRTKLTAKSTPFCRETTQFKYTFVNRDSSNHQVLYISALLRLTRHLAWLDYKVNTPPRVISSAAGQWLNRAWALNTDLFSLVWCRSRTCIPAGHADAISVTPVSLKSAELLYEPSERALGRQRVRLPTPVNWSADRGAALRCGSAAAGCPTPTAVTLQT